MRPMRRWLAAQSASKSLFFKTMQVRQRPYGCQVFDIPIRARYRKVSELSTNVPQKLASSVTVRSSTLIILIAVDLPDF